VDTVLFLLHPTGGNSFFLLYSAGGHSLVLLSHAGKQFDHTYFYREETKIYICFHLQGEVRANCFHLQGKVRARSTKKLFSNFGGLKS
jgi:hypothetical protein